MSFHDTIALQQYLKIETGWTYDVKNFSKYHDGFSFTVKHEQEAYRCAYVYRHCKDVRVSYAPNVKAWLVQVYTEQTVYATPSTPAPAREG